MKIDTSTPRGKGQFRRLLRKINQASRNMRAAHSGTYSERFCQKRRFKKWKRIHDSLSQKHGPKRNTSPLNDDGPKA